ncbi:MAG: AsmA family protein, partial [Aestuariivirgaceae bacterium]
MWRSPLLYLGIALILIAGAALTAPLYIDWNSYRTDIEDYGRQLTGRKVHIGGDIRARLFPWPVVWLEKVRVENPPGAKLPDLMRADQIEMRLALAPLVSGKFVVEGVRVDQPAFAFERLATGAGTWQLQPRVTLTEMVNVEAVTVAGIEIVDGVVVLADGRRGGAAKIA